MRGKTVQLKEERGVKMKNQRFVLFALILGLIGSIGFHGTPAWVSAKEDPYEGLKVFTEVLSAVRKNYVEPVNNKELLEGALQGILATLDPYSSYMSPEVYKESQIDTKGVFGGIGLHVGMKDKKVVVIAAIEATPAMRAGIEAGDIILKVDDQDLAKGVSLLDAVHRMRGLEGTPVTLTIKRNNISDPLVFKLVREVIHVQSVLSKVVEPGIGYIRLTQFQEQTARDMIRALSQLKEDKIHSLILDLRNNPGGLLNSSVNISEQFLEKGKLVVSVKGRDGKNTDFVGQGTEEWKNIPLIVLVNGGSASASEIVSGALQDWGRAVILGTPTFGKGSVQTILPLSDGSALRLTTAKYYTPNGRSIADLGVQPDILVGQKEKVVEPEPEEEGSPKSSSKIKKQPKESPVETGEDDTEKDTEKDVPLQKAIDLLKSFKIFKGGPGVVAQ